MFIILFLIFFLSFFFTFASTPLVIIFARKLKLVDNPKLRFHPAHTHQGVIPRAGGISLFFGIFFPTLFFIPFSKTFFFIILGALILILVGVWDDRKDRSPYIRFLTCCLAAIMAIIGGVGIPYITHPFDGIIPLDIWKLNLPFFFNYTLLLPASLFALLWIVWTTNIVGWSGGVDGQLPGFVSISACIIGFLSLRYPQDPVQPLTTYLAFATSGAFLGFLPWNFYPQKIMPGYGGKTLAGFMLAVLSILSYSKLGTAILVLIVPITDAIFVFTKRILSRKSPVFATKEHLHHHLLSWGWSKRKIAFFYWLISLGAGIVALTLNSKQKVFTAVLILVLILAFIFWLNFFKKLPQTKKDQDFA